MSQRIITHMNKDHQLALVDYLVVYGKTPLSSFKPATAELVAVDTTSMTIRYMTKDDVSKEKTIEWEHAQEEENLKVAEQLDIKAKIIAMAKYAAAAQGYSHKRVNKVLLPKKPVALSMYVVAVLLAVGCYDKTLIRRTVYNDAFLSKLALYAPKALALVWAYTEEHAKRISIIMYAIHVVEIVSKTNPATKRVRMDPLKRVAWAFMNFIEGFLSFERLAELEK